MWYSKNTSQLAETQKYKIGYDTIEKINLALEPEQITYQNKIVSVDILGFPIIWKDQVEKKITYLQTNDYNVDFRCPKASKFNSTDIVFNLGIHFTENEYIHKYYSFDDILATIGGQISTLALVSSQFGVIYVSIFLYRVIKVIKLKTNETYKNRLEMFINITKKLIKKIVSNEKNE